MDYENNLVAGTKINSILFLDDKCYQNKSIEQYV